MRKLSMAEQYLVKATDRNNYKIYRCPKHGIFTQKNENSTGKCVYNCGYVAESEFDKQP